VIEFLLGAKIHEIAAMGAVIVAFSVVGKPPRCELLEKHNDAVGLVLTLKSISSTYGHGSHVS
jgi:hypothetical protein